MHAIAAAKYKRYEEEFQKRNTRHLAIPRLSEISSTTLNPNRKDKVGLKSAEEIQAEQVEVKLAGKAAKGSTVVGKGASRVRVLHMARAQYHLV